MPEKNLLQRFRHGAAALTAGSGCAEVIVFGGRKEPEGPHIADSVVLRFGILMWRIYFYYDHEIDRGINRLYFNRVVLLNEKIVCYTSEAKLINQQ